MYIIIDSSNQLLYTGIVSGGTNETLALYDGFERIFKDNGVSHKFHWSKLSWAMRNKIKKPLANLLEATPRVNLNVLQHRKPRGVEDKDWYLNHIPARIAQRLERWLCGRAGSVELIVDDDYNVIRGGSGTTHFIETLIRQISIRLTNKEVTIRKEDKIKATIKQANGNILTIYASVGAKDSKWIGLVDVYLGAYIADDTLFSNLKNVYYSDNRIK